MTELWERDAWELADDVRAGKLKAVDLLDHFLARVERFNEELNAFCFLDVERAREDAAEIDAAVALRRGEGALSVFRVRTSRVPRSRRRRRSRQLPRRRG